MNSTKKCLSNLNLQRYYTSPERACWFRNRNYRVVCPSSILHSGQSTTYDGTGRSHSILTRFVVYSTTLPVPYITLLLNGSTIMGSELERVKRPWPYSRFCPGTWLEEMGKITRNLFQDCRSPGPDTNQRPSGMTSSYIFMHFLGRPHTHQESSQLTTASARSRVSSGSIVSDLGLDDRAIGVLSPAEAKGFFL
jgi:hypothetical protein